MPSSCCSSFRTQTRKVSCVQMCTFYFAMYLVCWPLSSEAARPRCGSDLLSDLIFVCGERGIYLGKGTRSGYGARPRGKGIVDKCCRTGGCELQDLEKYCAKPKIQQHTTDLPATTTAAQTTTQPDSVQLFQAVFHKRLLENKGAPNGPRRETHRKKTQPSASPSKRRVRTGNTSGRNPPASGMKMQLES